MFCFFLHFFFFLKFLGIFIRLFDALTYLAAFSVLPPQCRRTPSGYQSGNNFACSAHRELHLQGVKKKQQFKEFQLSLNVFLRPKKVDWTSGLLKLFNPPLTCWFLIVEAGVHPPCHCVRAGQSSTDTRWRRPAKTLLFIS